MNLVKTDSTPIVSQRGGKLYTTSLDVAEKFGKRHDNVLQSIKKIISDSSDGLKLSRQNGRPALKNEGGDGLKTQPGSSNFGLLNFKESSYLDEQKQQRPMYEMTRSGFSILAMGFTGQKALEWKIRYEQAFSLMEKAITRQANLSWQEQRQQSKIARREFTDVVQTFVVYAEEQGSCNARYYYRHLTEATYKALFLIECNFGPSFRDLLNSMQLNLLGTAEIVAATAMADGMDQDMFYKDIYQLAKSRIESFAAAVPRTEVISDQRSLPAMVQ